MVGLAKTGLAVAAQLASEGCAVIVTDDGPLTAALQSRIDEVAALGCRFEFAIDQMRVDKLVGESEYVVPSPGVKPSHPIISAAHRLGKPVRSEIDIAAERFTFPIVAVTGTNGKTTTVEMITAMLRQGGLRVESGGNIGTPLVSFVGSALDVVVAEVSSFQLEFVTSHWQPRVAVLLNIADDHLDWHGTFSAYRSAKARIALFQSADDVLVANIDDEVVRSTVYADTPANERAVQSQLVEVTIETARRGQYRVEDGVLCSPDGELLPVEKLPRRLPHDLTNSLCASAATFALRSALGLGQDRASVVEVLENYETLPHRVQFIGENQGVKFFNDSKATNPHATLRAVSAFESVVLIAGGLNKGLDLSVLRSAAPQLRAVVAIGSATDEVLMAFRGVVPVQAASDMADAVQLAAAAAKPGDVVLLSPGCASFDMYTDGYTARGDDFSAEVRAIITKEPVS